LPTSRRLHRRRLLQAGALTLGAALLPRLGVRAQAASSVKTSKLGELALLEVGGVNVLALHGNGGALMVDGGPKASADALLQAVYAATGNDKVSTLILTHGHPEQTGAAETVGRAGGTILATEKTKIFLSNPVRSALYEKTLEPLPEPARPTKTVRADGALDVAGHKVEYGYLPAAHTDGDLFVHFRDQNVLAAGGVVAADKWPLLDYKNGAWFGGRVRALERLATLVKPDTRVVPAEGRLMTGRDIAHLRDIYDTLFKTMIDYMNMGLGAEDVTVRNPLKPYEAEFGDAAAFLDGAYRSMQIAYVPD
jgi:glyoxylase-like metal-dependent hydrolase (beta-lactamase superfamily II)